MRGNIQIKKFDKRQQQNIKNVKHIMKKKLREDKHRPLLRSFKEKKIFCLKIYKLSNISHVYHHSPGMIRRNDTVEKRQDFFPR